MRGKWAQGIEPRRFTWVIKNQMAVCERPGGYGAEHRKVRRQQEILWIRKQGFVVVSLCSAAQNLASYKEMGVRCRNVPFSGLAEGPGALVRVMMALRNHLRASDRLLVHREQCDEGLMGVMAAYLLWTGLVPTGPQALAIVEHLFHREVGQLARELVALVDKCPPPPADEPPPEDDTPADDVPAEDDPPADDPPGGAVPAEDDPLADDTPAGDEARSGSDTSPAAEKPADGTPPEPA